MVADEHLVVLIGGIYDAALDVALWPGVLREIRDFVGGSAASLYAKDATAKQGNVFYHDGGIAPRWTQLYFEKYIKVDPSTTAHFFAEIGKPMATSDFISYDEFLETRFYKEWVRPQRLVDHVTVALDKSATRVAMFGVFRHQRHGLVNDETRRRMALIAPHVRRALLIGKTIDLKIAEAAAFADALDGLSAAMFMLDANARIVHANTAGHAMLAAGDVLRTVGTRLVAVDPDTEPSLQQSLAAAASGDAAVGHSGIAVPLAAPGREPYLAHVLPLTSGARRRAGAGYAAAAALFVCKADLTAPAPLEVLARHYKLTPTELRILLALVQIGGVPETAEALGIAPTTVRTHVRRLYEKMDIRRQADLVRLVAKFGDPLLG